MPVIYLTRDIMHNGFPYTVGEWRVSDEDAAYFTAQGVVGEAPADPDAPAPEADDGMPLRGDFKAAWVDYAVSRGMSREDAEAATKDELIAQWG